MTIPTTPNLSLSLLEQNMASKEILINEGFSRLDALLHNGAKSMSTTTPPASPTAPDLYIIPPAATGAWAGHTGKLTYFDTNAGWVFIAPREGATVWVNDADALFTYDGTSWTQSGNATRLTQLGINATADATNKLTVKSSASLFDNIGASIQITLNKFAATDTASQLFHTNFSGRAEIGLTGDDDLHIKVSADGTAWNESLVCKKSTGILEAKKRVDLSAGLSFNSGAHTLAHYEEGTFTPAYSAASGSPTITHAIQEGFYTRIGRIVFISLRISTSAFTAAGTAKMRISGLPYTAMNTPSMHWSLTIGYASGFGSANSPLAAYILENNTLIEMVKSASTSARSASSSNIIETDFGTTNDILISGYYFI